MTTTHETRVASPASISVDDMMIHHFGSAEIDRLTHARIGEDIRKRKPLPRKARKIYPDAFDCAASRAHIRPATSKTETRLTVVFLACTMIAFVVVGFVIALMGN